MTLRRLTSPLLPLLVLGATLAFTAPAHAQYGRDPGGSGTSATLRVNFGTTLHWTSIRGTRVEEIPTGERPNYDMFRYGGSYYAYNNNRWYRSPVESGDFAAIDDRDVPGEFATISRDHWRNYPAQWQSRQDQGSQWQSRSDQAPSGVSGSLQVNLGNSTRWGDIQGTRVREIQQGSRPNYDMFGYGNSYYVYDNDRWYSSPSMDGQFNAIDDSDVPQDFMSIPRDHWRNYPSRWASRYDQGTSGPSASLQVNLGNTARWSEIQGTRVREIQSDDRPNYDMFGYGDSYYIYDNDRWYASRSTNGRFSAIDDRNVPQEFTNIPRSHWRNYPSSWQNHRDWRSGGPRATLHVSFSNKPRWTPIRGTRVTEIRQADRPDYDMFGYAGSYYIYRDSRWYTSHRRTGSFTEINARSVPGAFADIPRNHWRNYPSSWQNGNDNRQ